MIFTYLGILTLRFSVSLNGIEKNKNLLIHHENLKTMIKNLGKLMGHICTLITSLAELDSKRNIFLS